MAIRSGTWRTIGRDEAKRVFRAGKADKVAALSSDAWLYRMLDFSVILLPSTTNVPYPWW